MAAFKIQFENYPIIFSTRFNISLLPKSFPATTNTGIHIKVLHTITHTKEV